MVNTAPPVLQMKFLIPNDQKSFSSLALLATVFLYSWLIIVLFQQKIRSCPTGISIPPDKGLTFSWGECSCQLSLMAKVSSISMTYRFVLWKSGTKSSGVLAFCPTHTVGSWGPELSVLPLLSPVPGAASWLTAQRGLIFCTGWTGEVP